MTSTDIDNVTVQPPWITLSDDEIFHRRYFAYGVYDDRYILIAGGVNNCFEGLSSAMMYDVHNKKSIELPNLPFEGYCLGVVLDDFFYVYHYNGHLFHLCLPSRDTHTHTHTHADTDTQKWEESEHVLGAFFCDLICDRTHIYMLYEQDNIDRYDPKTDEISHIPDSPIPRSLFFSAIVGTRIFVMGGFFSHEDELESYSDVDVFDTSTQSWSKAPPLPKPLYNATTTVFRRWILVTGGSSELDENEQTFVFDTIQQQWSKSNLELYQNFDCFKCVSIGSQVICLGGWNSNKEYSHMKAIHIKYLLPSWNNIKHFILLRQLIDDGRAHPAIVNKKIKFDANDNTNSNTLKVIETLLTDMSLDVFRNIIYFLI